MRPHPIRPHHRSEPARSKIELNVSTGGSTVSARSAEAVAFASMGGDAMSARSAERHLYLSVSMGGSAVSARSAEVKVR